MNDEDRDFTFLHLILTEFIWQHAKMKMHRSKILVDMDLRFVDMYEKYDIDLFIYVFFIEFLM